ncbi:MAG: bifunctional UDP-N-acetylglucosamine diphosphorylase/glucosamine-1-phosphate N-acetyltransferase GlmU [Gammaproteobacteria bacterium]|nr:bifunctional UDP-N-acetylglucosamine diphosphorylase/glucosamine-1-phosphate N-acetyltransferase GlmU [Gammaproteobacteria bacterium]
MTFSALILAAGKGTRMKSNLPKVIHPIGGKPMLQHVVDAARAAGAAEIVVVIGHGGETVKSSVKSVDHWVEQAEQLGTGHAVKLGLRGVSKPQTIVLYGDVPMIQSETITDLVNRKSAVLCAELDDPTGYGRVVIDLDGYAQRIIEHKDANDSELKINKINTGILTASTEHLIQWCEALNCNNAQGEYYLTDVVEMANDNGQSMQAVTLADIHEGEGVNNRVQQARLERVFQQRMAEKLMIEGVTLQDPSRLDVQGSVTVGSDCHIGANVQLYGDVSLGDGVVIEANCVIKDAVIGSNTRIRAFSHLEGASVGQFAEIGPYARLRPGTQLADQTKIGNFVETKNVHMGQGSKANHLTYLGDSLIGENTNIGAGTITCNYDGANKHQTVMGNNVFIGSNAALVAPVKIGDGATVAAGSVITTDAEPNALVVARAKQRVISGWKRPVKSSK